MTTVKNDGVPSTVYSHLRTRTDYSLHDGSCKVDDLILAAKQSKMPAVGVMDYNTLAAIPELVKKAFDAKIKPIIGLSINLQLPNDKKHYQIGLIAENDTGYKNLVQLFNDAQLNNCKHYPLVTLDMLRQYEKGLICLTGPANGVAQVPLFKGDLQKSVANITLLRDALPEGSLYVELTNNGVSKKTAATSDLYKNGYRTIDQNQICILLQDIATQLNIQVVATGDVRYIDKDEAKMHDIYLDLGRRGSLATDKKRFSLLPNFYEFKPSDELADIFSAFKTALGNVSAIVDRCNYNLDFNQTEKNFTMPTVHTYSNDEYLKVLCVQGLIDKFKTSTIDDKYWQRLETELKAIKAKGASDYFLFLADVMNMAKQKQFVSGPGRGSVAGSLVAYCLGITAIDPIRYNLIFERFISSENDLFPDVDFDFGMNDRMRIMDYVASKYSTSAVSIYGKYSFRGAIHNLARYYELDTGLRDEIITQCGSQAFTPLADDLAKPGLQVLRKYSPTIDKIIKTAIYLHGKRHIESSAAAAMIISNKPLADEIPLSNKIKVVKSVYSGPEVESLGYIKQDFLGLRTLDIIKTTTDQLAKKSINVPGIDNLPMGDKNTYKLFQQGLTNGVFQLESAGMQDALRMIKPKYFKDIVAAVALYRPNNLSLIPEYANRHTMHQSKVKQILGTQLPDTYGIILYMEDIIELAHNVAGFSYGHAENMRRALDKRHLPYMLKFEKEFIKGCISHGKLSKLLAMELWQEIDNASDHVFNKAHATSYAMLCYMTAYLKANYPKEYLDALISHTYAKDAQAKYIAELEKLKATVSYSMF